MWRLFRPLRYFALRNHEKQQIDLWPTLLLCAVIALPFLLTEGAPFFRPGGFLDKLIGLTSALTGFYVAALVAAATFAHPDLDRVITIGAITLPSRNEEGHLIREPVTRREFACTIFGYLAFSSFLFAVSSALIVSLSAPGVTLPDWFSDLYGDEVAGAQPVIRGILIVIYSAALAHIMVATSLGIYYLMDRLHVRKPLVATRKDAA